MQRFWVYYFILLFSLITNNLFCQQLWSAVTPNGLPIQLKPAAQFATWRLDPSVLESKLALAKGTSKQQIELPMPDGSFRSFEMQERSVMHPDLAAKYPELRTFKARSTDKSGARAVLMWSQQGFDAYITENGKEPITVAPLERGSQSVVSYARSSVQAPSGLDCVFDNTLHQVKGTASGAKGNSGSCQYRSYRAAVACTGEYATFHGGTKPLAMAAIVSVINRVNMVLEDELAIHLELVPNNDLLIYLNPVTDPYTNNDGSAMLGENQTTVDAIIGAANYDIGHVFSTGGGGLAYVGAVCLNNFKAGGVTGLSSPVGDPFAIDYVAHEVGHQLGGSHTMNNDCNRNQPTAFEPGSGSTIMAYAGICSPNVQSSTDAYYHAASLEEIKMELASGFPSTCGTVIPGTNQPPVAQAGTDYTVPKSTPLILTGSATDPNDATLYYAWEQYDNQVSTQPPLATNTVGPQFRTFMPTTSPIRYLPRLSTVLANSTDTWEVLPSVARTLNFRLTVRDWNSAGGCTAHDDMQITVHGAAGPFNVTALNSVDSVTGGSTFNLTWNVAGTDAPPVSCSQVDILLSTDGGLTFGTVLASAVPNDGAQSILIPNTPTNNARIQVRCSNNIFYDINNANFKIGASAAPPPLTVGHNIIHSTCGDSNGSIAVTPGGGTTPYQITWSTSSSNPTITNLAAGTYSVTITDGSGARWDTAFVLLTTTPPGIDRVEVYDASGNANDTIACYNIPINFGAYNVFGQGTGTLYWEWSTSSPVASFTGPTTGQFAGINTTNHTTVPVLVPIKLVVSDILGCKDSTTVQITAQPFLSVDSIQLTDNSGTIGDRGICFGDSATFRVFTNISGTYSYSWSNGMSGNPITFAPPYNLENTVYTVTITDQAGCQASLFTSAKGIPEIITNATYIDACPNLTLDTLRITVTGGGQFPGGTYQFFFNQQLVGEFHTSPHTHPFLLPPGQTYSIWLRDEKGCRDSISQLIPPDMCSTPCVSDSFEICIGETYTLTSDPAATGPIYWYKNNVQITGATGPTYIVTEPGSYHYTSTNAQGCLVSGCCPVVFEPGVCNPVCPPIICLPVTILRN